MEDYQKVKKRESNKKYQQTDSFKSLIKKVVVCEKCGCSVTYFNKSNHQKSKKCQFIQDALKNK